MTKKLKIIIKKFKDNSIQINHLSKKKEEEDNNIHIIFFFFMTYQ